jgi:hypothetical protein
MKQRVQLVIFIFYFLTGLNPQLVSGMQTDTSSVQKHDFNESKWKEVTRGIDYSNEKKLPELQKKNTKSFNFPAFAGAAKIILYVLVGALLTFLIYRILKMNPGVSDKSIKKELIYSEIDEADIANSPDLDLLYADAVKSKRYKLAVRVFYMMMIRELSELKLIQWRKEKTNFDYVTELTNHGLYFQFRDVTLLFERIWYGEKEISEQVFNILDPKFRIVLNEIKTAGLTNGYPLKDQHE